MLQSPNKADAQWAFQVLQGLDDERLEQYWSHASDPAQTLINCMMSRQGSSTGPPLPVGKVVRFAFSSRMGDIGSSLLDPRSPEEPLDPLKDRWRAYRAQGR